MGTPVVCLVLNTRIPLPPSLNQSEALLSRWPPTGSFVLLGTGTATVQNCTDGIFLPAYGELEGVCLLAAHPHIYGRLRWCCVSCHVKPGTERIPVCSEPSPR